MKEVEARKKICPHLAAAMQISLSNYTAVGDKLSGPDADALIDKIGNTALCNGSDCVMWDAYQKSVDLKTSCDSTNNTETSRPDGDDWYLVNTFIHPNKNHEAMWRRYVDNGCGDCGLKTKKLQCNV